MFRTLLNVFRVPELRNKVLFTLFHAGDLSHRVQYSVARRQPSRRLKEMAEQQQAQKTEDAASKLMSYASIFSGVQRLQQSTDLRPWRDAPISRHRLSFSSWAPWCRPSEKLQKEGQSGCAARRSRNGRATSPFPSIVHDPGHFLAAFSAPLQDGGDASWAGISRWSSRRNGWSMLFRFWFIGLTCTYRRQRHLS